MTRALTRAPDESKLRQSDLDPTVVHDRGIVRRNDGLHPTRFNIAESVEYLDEVGPETRDEIKPSVSVGVSERDGVPSANGAGISQCAQRLQVSRRPSQEPAPEWARSIARHRYGVANDDGHVAIPLQAPGDNLECVRVPIPPGQRHARLQGPGTSAYIEDT